MNELTFVVLVSVNEEDLLNTVGDDSIDALCATLNRALYVGLAAEAEGTPMPVNVRPLSEEHSC